MTIPIIFGVSGTKLTSEEESFFTQYQPAGFILFKRNVIDQQQLTGLVRDLTACVRTDAVPILIDQEGGRVVRIKLPGMRQLPPSGEIGALVKSAGLEAAKQAAYSNAHAIGTDLKTFGINVNCAPVLDLLFDGADSIIGDRSFGKDPAIVYELGLASCLGFLDAGVTPVIKHIPGHGRALLDSHKALPRVNTSRTAMETSDFVPFRKIINDLRERIWAMTAHIVYDDIDPSHPATQSKIILQELIREDFGFPGVIVSDDIGMKALNGSMAERALLALDAGCDIVLHCSGNMTEMTEIAEGFSTYQLESHFHLNHTMLD